MNDEMEMQMGMEKQRLKWKHWSVEGVVRLQLRMIQLLGDAQRQRLVTDDLFLYLVSPSHYPMIHLSHTHDASFGSACKRRMKKREMVTVTVTVTHQWMHEGES